MLVREKLLAGLSVSLTAAGMASAIYQWVSERQDRRRFPPPGQMIDVGGRRLHLVDMGAGTLPVVIVPALGDSVLDLEEFYGSLATAGMRVCRYDRSGLGWSDPLPGRQWTFEDMADELQQCLTCGKIEPPYVLAGHSLGGIVAQHFAARYPEKTAGLLLIDSSHQQQGSRYQVNGRPSGMQLRRRALERRLRLLGAYRLYTMTGRGRLNAGIRKDVLPTRAAPARALGLKASYRNAVVRELRMMARQADPPPRLGSLPVTVLTAADYEETWMTLQKELACLSTQSVHIVADKGGHYLQRDNPEFVASALRDLLARITAGPGDQKDVL